MTTTFLKSRTLSALFAVALAGLHGAHAADLPPLRPTIMPVEHPNPWNSCFLGGTLGLSVTNATVKPDAVPELDYPIYTTAKQAQVVMTQVGPELGVTAGCDRSYGDYIVGFQGDFDYMPGKTKGITGYADPWLQEIRLTNQFRAAASLRFGKAFGNTLIYAKLGISATPHTFQSRYTAASLSYVESTTQPGVFYPSRYISTVEDDKARWLFGPTLGLGMEHMLSANWSTKVEADVTYFKPTRSAFTFVSASGKVANPGYHLPSSNTWNYLSQGLLSSIKMGVNYRM